MHRPWPSNPILCAALLVWALLLASPAAAQPRSDDESARLHFEAATEYFRRGAYAEAEREFLASYELSHRPQLFFNIYLSRERLGDFAGAAEALRRYLAEGGDVQNRDELEDRLANLDRRAAQRAAEERTRAEAEARAAEASSGGSSAPESDGGSGIGAPALVAYGVGGAGVITYAIAGGLAIASDRDLAGTCGRDSGRTCSASDVAPLHTRSVVADVGLALGLAGAATGLVLTFVMREPGDDRASVVVVPSLAEGRLGLLAAGRF